MKLCNWKHCSNEVIGSRLYCSKRCNQKSCVDRRRREIKIKAVELLGGKCSVCGYSKCVRALHFHHMKDKLFGLSSKGITRSWNQVQKELEKCILLCANCHSELHSRDINPSVSIKKIETALDKECLHCKNRFSTYNQKSNYCSGRCSFENRRKVIWPSKQELTALINTIPITKIAKMYNVSDKAVHKWCERLGVDKKGPGFWSKLKYSRIV